MSKLNCEAPEGLSNRSKELWHDVVPRRCSHPEQLALLRVALVSLDRADEAAATLAEEGITLRTLGSGTVHAHPAVAIEKEARAAFAKMWAALNLNWIPSGCGDPEILQLHREA